MPEILDKDIFNKIKNNDQKAFAFLFREYYTGLCKLAFYLLNDKLLAEEAVQEIFIIIWEQRHSIELKESIRQYLITSVRNKCLNKIKEEKTRQKYEQESINETQLSESSDNEDFHNADVKILVSEAIESLPEKCKEVFELSKYDGLTYSEIADYLKISKKTVENQIGTAYRKLKEFLQPYKNKFI